MKYILKKDFPNIKEGTILVPCSTNSEYYSQEKSENIADIGLTKELVENNPDWFQKCTIISAKTIEDKKWTDGDMERCWYACMKNEANKRILHLPHIKYIYFDDYLNKAGKDKWMVVNDDFMKEVTLIGVTTDKENEQYVGLKFSLMSVSNDSVCTLKRHDVIIKTNRQNVRLVVPKESNNPLPPKPIIDEKLGYVKPNEANQLKCRKKKSPH